MDNLGWKGCACLLVQPAVIVNNERADDTPGLRLPSYRRSATAACHALSEQRQQRAITV
jgi:hypothetical protein